MKTPLRAALLSLLLCGSLCVPRPLLAEPLGNSTCNGGAGTLSQDIYAAWIADTTRNGFSASLSAAQQSLICSQVWAFVQFYSSCLAADASTAGCVTTLAQTFAGNKTFSGTLTVSTASPGLQTQEAWTAPTLLNTWSNLGSGFIGAGYLKDSLGFVHVRGVVTGGTPSATSVVFTLPAGYRPASNHNYPTTSNLAFGHILVNTAGSVIAYQGSGADFSLDTILFDTR